MQSLAETFALPGGSFGPILWGSTRVAVVVQASQYDATRVFLMVLAPLVMVPDQ